jgi:hypothetical protein
MKMKSLSKLIFIFFIFTGLLSGCVVDQALQKWSVENYAAAEAGKMPWSEYYLQFYKQAEASQQPNKGAMLGRINAMITLAKMYESGQITKDQFETGQRMAKAEQAIDDENAELQTRRAMAAGFKAMGDANKSVTCSTYGYGNSATTTCR